jgi:predicted anti-sigma-YlaC factor YlaD
MMEPETATACTPVSWLRLERYALGELDRDVRADVAGHLATCDRCRACAERIAADARELPPLPATAPPRSTTAAPALAPPARWRHPWRGRGQALAIAGAAAAIALVALWPREHGLVGGPHAVGPQVISVKGGDVAIELVRERDGSTAWEPTSFAPGDRFKLLVTCPPPLRIHADVVVIQSDGPAFPGAPASVGCGNRVPLTPAFRITGPGAATVCVGVDPSGPPSRAALASGDGAAAGPHACLRLERGD